MVIVGKGFKDAALLRRFFNLLRNMSNRYEITAVNLVMEIKRDVAPYP